MNADAVQRSAWRVVGCLALALAGLPGTAFAEGAEQNNPCGSLTFGYGPFDYRTDRDKLPIVEKYHFTPAVENLVKPMFSTFAADLSYTLSAFPNHHRALATMLRNSERLKDPKPPGAEYSVDCYFERALRFRGDDVIVRMLYAEYLSRHQRAAEAISQVDYVVGIAGESLLTHLNAGLLYESLKAYDKALAQARTVERLGGDPKLLRDRLQAANKWQDAPAEPGASAPSGTAGAPGKPTSN